MVAELVEVDARVAEILAAPVLGGATNANIAAAADVVRGHPARVISDVTLAVSSGDENGARSGSAASASGVELSGGGPVTSMKSLTVSRRQRDSCGESSEYIAQPNVVLSAAWCVVCTWLPCSTPFS